MPAKMNMIADDTIAVDAVRMYPILSSWCESQCLHSPIRHAGLAPASSGFRKDWIPAFAGMTD
jgi:hypothetical protein